MLKNLEITNYVLIEHLNIQFENALNVITGETGAGKSIILGALGMIIGKRSDTKTLRNSSLKCIVEATFEINSNKKELFTQLDLDFDIETIIRREVSPSGKSRAFINDTPVNLKTLQILTTQLLAIHQQFDTQRIAEVEHQLQLIDWYAGNDELLEAYQIEFEDYNKLLGAKRNIDQKLKKILDQQQLNEFMLAELDEFGLTKDDVNLGDELDLLEKSEGIRIGLEAMGYGLNDGEQPLLDQLKALLNTLVDFSVKDVAINEFVERFNTSITELEELAGESRTLIHSLDFDESDLLLKRERMEVLFSLQRKHQVNSIEGLMEKWEMLQNESSQYEELETEKETIVKEIDNKKSLLEVKAGEISSQRKKFIPLFIEKWTKSLKALAMPNVKVSIPMIKVKDFTRCGYDELEFQIAINRGSSLLPLAEVASGGEMSRMALAVSGMLSNKMAIETLIFDEIDTGVSGEISNQMGKVLGDISKHRQVLCITHSPQIASKGNIHFKVYKEDLENETISTIILLDKQGRIEELATMLSGAERSSAAIENAKVLLGVN